MSTECNSISIHFVQALIKGCLRRGIDYQPIMQEVGINNALLATPHARITPVQFARLIKKIIIMSDDEFLNLGSHPSKFGIFSLMAKQVIHSPDLRTALLHSCHFYNLISKAIRLKLVETDGKASLNLTLTSAESDPDCLLREYLLFVWLRFINWLIGKSITIDCVSFEYPQPAHSSEYRLMFPCPVKFNQPTNCLEFPALFLDQPVLQSPQTLHHYLKRIRLNWIERENFYLSYSRKVVKYLKNCNNFNTVRMEMVASHLHITTRTLRRKLVEENTSFQALKDQLQCETGIQYLSQSPQPLVQISTQLGFSEPSAFTRASKSWTGVSPGVYRNQSR